MRKNKCFQFANEQRKIAQIFTVLVVCFVVVLSGCSRRNIVITPLQKAKRDYWLYQKRYTKLMKSLEKQGELDNSGHEARNKFRTDYLGLSNELENILKGIYSYEYRKKFGHSLPFSFSMPPIYIAYLRIRYTYPEKTERELRELYRESVKRGEVKATIDGKHWKWNPEDDKEDDK